MLDRVRKILAEARVEKVVVIADLKARLGEEVGKVLLEILIDALKAIPGFRIGRRFELLHCGAKLTAHRKCMQEHQRNLSIVTCFEA